MKPSTQTAIFQCINGLLLRGFWQITRYTYAYNIIPYFKLFFIIPIVSHYKFSEAIFKESDLSIYTGESKAKKSPKQNILIAKESPFSAKQNGKISFCIGYFVYEIRGIKRMCVQKPL